MLENLKKYRIILASASPRRQQLLKGLGINFEIIIPDHEESYPSDLLKEQIPLYLAEHKAREISHQITDNQTVIITADTIVWLDGHDLGKPKDPAQAKEMLQLLSGRMHEVITGVCLKSLDKTISFTELSKVYFKDLSNEEIDYYLANYKPYDKAGSYGVQEWIGYIGISRIEGSYFNVMGLPIQKLYEHLLAF